MPMGKRPQIDSAQNWPVALHGDWPSSENNDQLEPPRDPNDRKPIK